MKPDSLAPEARSSALEKLARQAIDGDREALESLVRLLQADIYGLSLRMLWNREDAEDATQEILVRIVTRLSQFDFRSRLKTWAYRVAVNFRLRALARVGLAVVITARPDDVAGIHSLPLPIVEYKGSRGRL